MPRNPKIFFHNSVHFVTTSVEEGFIFPANPLCMEIIKKSLAQAQALHPVHISDILVESTHVHFILQVIDPQDAADFMERFKCESAHAINRLLGRKKHTIWCEGYDSPLIDDLDTIIQKLAYLYSNPVKDGLTDSIEQFPGFNSFYLRAQLAKGKTISPLVNTWHLPRTAFQPLGDTSPWTYKDYKLARRRIIQKRKKNVLSLSPLCWAARFGVTSEKQLKKLNKKILLEIRAHEQKHRDARALLNKTQVIGASQLKNTPLGAPFSPHRRDGRKMLTHSVHTHIRIQNITWMKELIAQGKLVLQCWREGNTAVKYPLGLFPPTGIRLAEPFNW